MSNNKKAIALLLCSLVLVPNALATGGKNVPPSTETASIQEESWTETLSNYISGLWPF